MTIILRPKNLYGRICYYPMSPLADALCELVKRKTLTDKQLDVLKKHKVSIEEVESDQ